MNLLGYDSLKEEFAKSFRSGKNHHAWIILGEKGVGKGVFAKLISRAVLGNKYHQAFSFEDGSDISEKILNETHPDLYVIHSDDKGVIGVESVRSLIKFMQLTPVEGKNKVAIIDYSDGMTISASNALLKVLEEPPTGGLILLVCNSIGKLIPTIRSRCRIMKVEPPTTQIFSDVITSLGYIDLSTEDILYLYNFTNGSVGLSVNIIENEAMDLLSMVKRQIDKNGGMNEVLEIANMVNKNQDLWNIASYAIVNFLQDLIRKSHKTSKECDNALGSLEKAMNIITDCDKLYLDKSSAIITMLG